MRRFRLLALVLVGRPDAAAVEVSVWGDGTSSPSDESLDGEEGDGGEGDGGEGDDWVGIWGSEVSDSGGESCSSSGLGRDLLNTRL